VWLRMKQAVPGGLELIADEGAGLDPRVADATFSLDVRALAHPLPAGALPAGARLSICTVLPGYDDRKVAPANGMQIPREEGGLYDREWQAVLRQPTSWVLIDSFNQWHNGTEIEPSVELGDRYLAATGRYARLFKSGKAR